MNDLPHISFPRCRLAIVNNLSNLSTSDRAGWPLDNEISLLGLGSR